ncbi:hypothetical protein H2248_002049 [Termitomyces sp. 'cryptogamus']|nr:hypothetical protein H2248_002049 [Termitomyces sp. 'cryptogamus']
MSVPSIHVEPITVSIGLRKPMEDWALIALHKNKFNWDMLRETWSMWQSLEN